MGLAEVYEQKFASKADTATEKKAEGEEAAAEASTEQAEGSAAEMSDAQIDEALNGMTDEQLQELAKEVASDVKESQAKESAESEKLAEEYFAAGRIFAQGFMSEVNGGKTASTKTASSEKGEKKAISKFAEMLQKELGQKQQ